MDMIEKIAQAGHLTEEQAERVRERVQSFVKAAQDDSDFYAEAQEKLGGIWDSIKAAPSTFAKGTMQQIPTVAANLAALSLIGGASGLASEAYKSVRDSSQKAKAYKTMMEEAGDRLEDIPPKQIQQSFNTLHRANPDYAQDPTVAAEFVRETSRSEAYPFQLLNMMRSGAPERSNMLQDYKSVMSPLKPAETSATGLASSELEVHNARKAAGLPVKS